MKAMHTRVRQSDVRLSIPTDDREMTSEEERLLNKHLTMTFALPLSLALIFTMAPIAETLADRWYTEAGIAVEGYDPVSYFTDGEAVKGDLEFHYTWDGVGWLFSSAEHRKMFKETPEKYAPQYGGHCSLGVAYGEKPSGSAEAWTVRDDKLYLNYDKKVRKRWLETPAKYIRMANEWWTKIRDKQSVAKQAL